MNFGMSYLDFQLSQYICFPCDFFDSLFNSKCVNSIHIHNFTFSFCCWFLVSFHCDLKRYFLWFRSLKKFWLLCCDLKICLSWKMFLVCTCMNNVYSAVDVGVFCLCLLIVLFSSPISLLIFPLALLSIIESGVGFKVSC